MKVLAISGSLRSDSTNTALLEAISRAAPESVEIRLFREMGDLPIFSPDLETPQPPDSVRRFIEAVDCADGLIISSPEYARAIPGGLKNAIDWLVSGEAVIGKPIALAHASHRGDDMLASLRAVLGTVSSRFNADIFLRRPLMAKSPGEIEAELSRPQSVEALRDFVERFSAFVESSQGEM
ncbi:NAD(P)H-dependent oxidoreductase [Hoeflea sp. WL0058]|uniref:NAD(P)H-dependent oxidoreductase n=1 Tax=Flavimaribacter sediminis TaxID=2865987 RepID=A0AAE2ZTD4_9HYPH|nr:NADPH-dependent FMN reductase [Flavimaribacter sediminis]MBW8639212.1 NAD(P)H-dependent oxidoreductase [Flavimaribacter sediminis]